MIFISYSSNDSALAHMLRARLEKDGVPCWMAPEDIEPGEDYSTQIPPAIKACDALLLLLTANAQQSVWVPKELDIALGGKRRVIPYQLDDAPLEENFSFRLSNVQSIHAGSYEDLGYGRLLKALRAQLAAGGQPVHAHAGEAARAEEPEGAAEPEPAGVIATDDEPAAGEKPKKSHVAGWLKAGAAASVVILGPAGLPVAASLGTAAAAVEAGQKEKENK